MLDAMSSLTGGGGLSSSSSATATGGNQTTSRRDTINGIQFGNQGLPSWVLPVTAFVAVVGVVWLGRK